MLRLVVLFVTLWSSMAWAALGGGGDSVLQDAQKLQVLRHASVPEGSYIVHDMTVSDAMAIREFVTPEGKVFAVAWHGKSKPDLHQLLGDYFDAYVQAAGAPGGHRLSHLQVGDIIVESRGHMLDFSGAAYVPALVPAGFALDQMIP